jgi:hypothetical protein
MHRSDQPFDNWSNHWGPVVCRGRLQQHLTIGQIDRGCTTDPPFDRRRKDGKKTKQQKVSLSGKGVSGEVANNHLTTGQPFDYWSTFGLLVNHLTTDQPFDHWSTI